MMTCRKGHPTSIYGKYKHKTAKRSAHLRCMECRRLADIRQAERGKKRRAARRQELGLDGKCRNGHDHSHSIPRVWRGKVYRRCKVCERNRRHLWRDKRRKARG